MSDVSKVNVLPEVSLFDIDLDMIKAPEGADGEIDLEEYENRENPHNADISHKVRNIKWDLNMLKEDLESSNQMIKDGTFTDRRICKRIYPRN